MTANLNNDYHSKPIEKDSFKLQKVKINPKNEIHWNGNKFTRLSMATAMFSITAVVLLVLKDKCFPKGCVNGFYDDLSDSYCENGRFEPDNMSLCIPQCHYEKYYNLIESCKRGDKISGCFHKNYYRELTPECKANPLAKLCDGKYDYVEWVNEINAWVNSTKPDIFLKQSHLLKPA